jgi:hypothetical protein
MTNVELITRDPSPVGADLRPAETEVSPEHLITALKRGAFVYMSCATCGWDGPARRAQANAERDAMLHQLTDPARI